MSGLVRVVVMARSPLGRTPYNEDAYDAVAGFGQESLLSIGRLVPVTAKPSLDLLRSLTDEHVLRRAAGGAAG